MAKLWFCVVFLWFSLFSRHGEGRVMINSSCRLPRKGSCINIWKCQSYVTMLNQESRSPYLKQKVRDNFCGLVDQKTPKVCCPDLGPKSELADSLRNHQNYNLLPKSCGPIWHGTRIIAGGSANAGEFPWMALIAYQSGDSQNNDDFKCAGSLINDRYVLTAAHCLDDSSILGIRLGEHNMQTKHDCDKKGENCQPPVQDVLIDKIVVHPRYNTATYVNDIALIRLATPANFSNESVQPICLPQDDLLSANLVGKFLTVTGWGTTETGHRSMVLSKVHIPVVPLKQCIKLYGKYKPISENQVCAGGYMGRDSCSGDSGGPLQYIAKDRYVQDGIVSYGPTQCGLDGRPAIYTNVKQYMTWILDNIEP